MKERQVSRAAIRESAAVAVATPAEWAAEVDERVTRTGTWIFVVADAFFFFAFFFAFFYLRAQDNDHAWMWAGVTHPTRAIGALIVALMVVTAGLYYFAMRSLPGARTLLWLALIAGLLAVGAQFYEFQHLGFDPQQGGGYPSVFVGFKGVLLVQFAGALLWLLTHIAQARPDGDLMARPATAARFSYFLIFLAGVSLLAYLVLYFI